MNISDYSSIRDHIIDGSLSPLTLVEEQLKRIQDHSRLNAFITVFDDWVREQAGEVERQIARGNAGPLAGMTVAVKDNICIKGTKVTCGSRMLERFESVYDAYVIEKLKKSGAIILGKTNMDEFAMGSSNENSAFGAVRSPVHEEYVPGGSSGGSAAAVAAGLAMTALGSDTGGSIRQPAAMTGVYGLKPTYGRVSRYGLIAFASSFEQIGPFARSIPDLIALFSTIAGPDKRDATSADVPLPDFKKVPDGNVKGMKIGIPREYFTDDLNKRIRKTIEDKLAMLKEMGAEISEISLPHTEYTIATYYILTTAEASSNLARYDGVHYGYRAEGVHDLEEMYVRSRTEGLGEEVKRRIMLGTFVLSSGYYDAYYRKAQKVRRLIKEDFDEAFKKVDCIITPTTPTTAFKLGEKSGDPLQMYFSDVFTTSANLAGIPGLSIPAGKDENGLPIGMQLLGKPFDEVTLLNVAYALERKK